MGSYQVIICPQGTIVVIFDKDGKPRLATCHTTPESLNVQLHFLRCAKWPARGVREVA